MNPIFTCAKHKIVFCLKSKPLFPVLLCMLIFCDFNYAQAAQRDSAIEKRPVVITSLEQCRIPASMVARVKHLNPLQIRELNEEYQHTDLTEDGREIVTIVRMRFIDNHITGYIKEALLNNTDKFESINYIDIPIEWMCIPPKRDHPFHFATSLSELDGIKTENGCLDWVQRDNDVIIKYAQEKPKKKGIFQKKSKAN
ncbi:hypothetical protein BH10BAC2_BH10BAC2_25130 [soil metagenome]